MISLYFSKALFLHFTRHQFNSLYTRPYCFQLRYCFIYCFYIIKTPDEASQSIKVFLTTRNAMAHEKTLIQAPVNYNNDMWLCCQCGSGNLISLHPHCPLCGHAWCAKSCDPPNPKAS